MFSIVTTARFLFCLAAVAAGGVALGEVATMGVTSTSSYILAPKGWLAFAALVFVASAMWTAWRRGKRKTALLIGATSVTLIGASVLLQPFVAAGSIGSLMLFPVAMLATAVAVGLNFTGETVPASVLSAEVVERDQRFRSFLEDVRLLVLQLDRQGRIESVNPALCELVGMASSDLVGRPFVELASAGERTERANAFESILRGLTGDPVEVALTDRFGGVHVISWSPVPLRDTNNEVTGAVSIGTDLTEQRRAEADRDKALAQTTAALAEVQALRARLEEEVVYLKNEITTAYGFDEIVGRSNQLMYVLHRVEQVAPLDTTVLIEGETGVGKELVARAIHSRSRRAARPMVSVNCAVLPASLVEAELFGHERGAFTGADRLRRGRFELADGGTLFLDEVAELPLDLQAKLLRVLQDGEFERVGGARTLRVDVRLIAATNRQLREEVQHGRFREDLYYRLHVFPLTVPPLRKRKEDLPALVDAFVRRFAREQRKVIDRVPQPVLDELSAYNWPGNIRELENIIERAVIDSGDGTLRLAERLTPASARVAIEDGYQGTLQDFERRYILQVLEMSHWRIEGERAAAQRLGLHPNTLRFRMRKLGIQRPSAAPTSLPRVAMH
jgi:PAS domain S-box-containing protein